MRCHPNPTTIHSRPMIRMQITMWRQTKYSTVNIFTIFIPNAPFQYFLTFWQIGIPASFIVMVGIRWAIAMVGFVLNLLLVSVSILNRLIHQEFQFKLFL